MPTMDTFGYLVYQMAFFLKGLMVNGHPPKTVAHGFLIIHGDGQPLIIAVGHTTIIGQAMDSG